METFYSILMVPLKPAIKEQISVALLLIGKSKVYFKYSNQKLNILKKLLPVDVFEMMKQYLIGIEKSISNLYDDKSNDDSLFPNKLETLNLTENYINYLSNYLNNLITFTKPTNIDLAPSENNFNILFEKFISDEYTKNLIDEQLSFVDTLKRDFYPKIDKRVNIDVDINKIIETKQFTTKSFLPEKIIFPETINFYGKNNHIISAQIIDFEKKTYYLKADLSYYINFINEFDDNNKNFIIGNEPEKSNKKNYQYWEDIRKFKPIEFVSYNEVDKIYDYLEENDVKPVFENEIS